MAALYGTVSDDWTTKPDGPITTALTGQTWLQLGVPSNVTDRMKVIGGHAATNGNNATSAAGYIDMDLGARVRRISAEFGWGAAGSVDTGFATILIWGESISTAIPGGHPVNAICHLGICPQFAVYDIYVNGVATNLLVHLFPTRLTSNGITTYPASVSINGSTASVLLPDSPTPILLTHPAIKSLPANFAGLEVFEGAPQTTAHRSFFTAMQADTAFNRGCPRQQTAADGPMDRLAGVTPCLVGAC